MALAFVLMLVMTAKLVWLVRDLMYPGVPVGWLEATSLAHLPGARDRRHHAHLRRLGPVGLPRGLRLVDPAGGGLDVLDAAGDAVARPVGPSAGWPRFALATIMTRTTGGWAVCLVSLGIGLWLLSGRLHPERRRTGWWVLGGAAAALVAGIAYNWVKFRHPYLFPLEDQVWTELNEPPPGGARGQRRHHHRPAVLHDLVRQLLPPRRDPVRRLLPVDHAARRAGPRRAAARSSTRATAPAASPRSCRGCC